MRQQKNARWRAWGLLGAFAALGIVLRPAVASAGPVEQLVQVALHPTNPQVMAVRYSWGGGGLIRTLDGGATWQLQCDAALGDTLQNGADVVAIAGTGTTIRASFSGLFEDDGHGCAWSKDSQYAGEWIGDLAPDPNDANAVFAVTATASTASQRKHNGVIHRDASGHWSDVGMKEELLATRLHAVRMPTGALRFYVSAVRGSIETEDGGVPQPNYVVRVSDDQAQTWTEHVLGAVDGTFRLQGVDPSNPDRLIATINRTRQSGAPASSGDDSVLVSNDRGAHFSEYLKLTEIGGVTFGPDGRVWIGDAGDSGDPNAAKGLWFAASLGEPAQPLVNGNYPVQCLGYQQATGTLFACQHFWFGSVTTDGTFTSMLKLNDVRDFVACPNSSDTAAVCQTQLCGAYCGFGHFAIAPVCSAYDVSNYCGAAVARAEQAGAGGMTATNVDAGIAGAAGTQSADLSSIDASVRMTGAKPMQPDQPKTATSQPTRGCSVLRVGASSAERRTRTAILALVLMFILRTRSSRIVS